MAEQATPNPPKGHVRGVILDLDGTIIDTETLCKVVAHEVLSRFSATLTPEACKASLGKRPLEAWQAVVDCLGLGSCPPQGPDPSAPVAQPSQQPNATATQSNTEAPTGQPDAQTLLDMSEPLLRQRWGHCRLLPGALRLLRHLSAQGVPFAIATSTPRSSLVAKVANKPELKGLITLAVCGDEVKNGKPAPDTFLAAAGLLGLDPSACLVVEDAPSGVQGALAAGMQVVLVPSLRDQAGEQEQGVQVLPSLLALQPEQYGLPPFQDTIHGAIPMDVPIHLKGEVVRGFGRGSKDLGIPTANVAGQALVESLADAVTGIYAGWASIGTSKEIHKMVMSIGYNPFFGNTEKTAEPWILSDFSEPFYGQELRLVVVAYIRPEAGFTSLQALIDRIHEDGRVTRIALDDPTLNQHCADPWLQPGESAAQLAQAVAAAASQKA